MDDGKINKNYVLPEEIKTPNDIKNLETLIKSKKAKILKKENLDETLRGTENTNFKNPSFDTTQVTKSFKDILDKDGRRHIDVRYINRGKIIKVKDL